MTPYDNPPPAPSHGEEPGGHAAPRSTNSGSQKRQRQYRIVVACNAAEFAAATSRAQDAGMSNASFARACMLGAPGPRAQRKPHINAVELAKATAALNKVGSLMNQMAHILNAGGSITFGKECLAALAEIRAAAAAILEAVRRKDRE